MTIRWAVSTCKLYGNVAGEAMWHGSSKGTGHEWYFWDFPPPALLILDWAKLSYTPVPAVLLDQPTYLLFFIIPLRKILEHYMKVIWCFTLNIHNIISTEVSGHAIRSRQSLYLGIVSAWKRFNWLSRQPVLQQYNNDYHKLVWQTSASQVQYWGDQLGNQPSMPEIS